MLLLVLISFENQFLVMVQCGERGNNRRRAIAGRHEGAGGIEIGKKDSGCWAQGDKKTKALLMEKWKSTWPMPRCIALYMHGGN